MDEGLFISPGLEFSTFRLQLHGPGHSFHSWKSHGFSGYLCHSRYPLYLQKEAARSQKYSTGAFMANQEAPWANCHCFSNYHCYYQLSLPPQLSQGGLRKPNCHCRPPYIPTTVFSGNSFLCPRWGIFILESQQSIPPMGIIPSYPSTPSSCPIYRLSSCLFPQRRSGTVPLADPKSNVHPR